MSENLFNLILAIVLTVAFALLGQTLLIDPINYHINKASIELKKLEDQKNVQNNLLNKLSRGVILINIDQEGSLMSKLLSNDVTNGLEINSYNLYNSYFYIPDNFQEEEAPQKAQQANNLKTANNSENSENPKAENTPEILSQLDENGMPLDAYSDSDADWKGLEIAPVKITFTGKLNQVSNVLRKLQSFPLNTIRSLDLVINKSSVKGTMVIVFPLNEN